MRRLVITFSAAVLMLSVAPAGALARHHHRRHHSRVHHARIERFGHDVASAPSGSGSADNAGTVQSFNNGVLTIMLSNGSAVSGTVTGDTETECTAPEQDQTVHEDGDSGSGGNSGNSGSGDNNAQSSGDQSSGNDQGDAAEQNGNQADDQNENQAEDQNENQAEHNCSTSTLAPGATVREAELRIAGTGDTWKKVQLGS